MRCPVPLCVVLSLCLALLACDAGSEPASLPPAPQNSAPMKYDGELEAGGRPVVEEALELTGVVLGPDEGARVLEVSPDESWALVGDRSIIEAMDVGGQYQVRGVAEGSETLRLNDFAMAPTPTGLRGQYLGQIRWSDGRLDAIGFELRYDHGFYLLPLGLDGLAPNETHDLVISSAGLDLPLHFRGLGAFDVTLLTEGHTLSGDVFEGSDLAGTLQVTRIQRL